MRKELPNRKRNRMKGYDYSSDGYYFVTICTKNRGEWFGEIVGDNIKLNAYGRIAADQWREIPDHYPNVELDEFVIMPNHVHGIVIITVGNGLKPFPTNKRHGLSEIMRGFKTFSSRQINEIPGHDHKFAWQKSFYDHIVRNDVELYRIRKYIQNNPVKWGLDRNKAGNLYM